MDILENNRKSYHLKIIERCRWLLNNDPSFKLEELKRGSVANEVLNFVYSFNTLETRDQTILKDFFETNDESGLNRLAKSKKEAFGKSVYELLTGKTKNPQKQSLIDISALFVNLQPRPYDKNFDYSNLNIETNYDSLLDKREIKEADSQEISELEIKLQEKNSIESKQTNILSFFNSSIIGKIKGKIRQFNFLGFGTIYAF